MTNRTFKSGEDRGQASFLPPRLDDYVGRDNPVRAIDLYVDKLDLIGLGFRQVGNDGGPGQPPDHPADLLKLYLYAQLNRIRSARRLASAASRHTVVMAAEEADARLPHDRGLPQGEPQGAQGGQSGVRDDDQRTRSFWR